MKKILFVLLLVILVSGCIDETIEYTSSENVSELEKEVGTDVSDSVESEVLLKNLVKLDVQHIFSGAEVLDPEDNETLISVRALSYMGAFAMIVKYEDVSLDLPDVIAYSGIGSSAEYLKKIGLHNAFGEGAIIEAANNLGYDIHLGLRARGLARSRMYDYNFENRTAKQEYFSGSEEAMTHLKKVLGLDKPVEVNVDAYFIESTLSEQSEFWADNKQDAHFSHFFTVIGYSDEKILLLDPNDPAGKILNVPESEFSNAWEQGARSGMDGAKLGPFWMITIETNGNPKSASKVINWNRASSIRAVNAIRSTKTLGKFYDLGVARQLFGAFLQDNDYSSSGELYAEAGTYYLSNPDKLVFQRIAANEQVARAKLQ